MLRLMGLPPRDRFPRVIVRRDARAVTLDFTGGGERRVVEVPLYTLDGDDPEAAQLRVAGRLRELGYAAELVVS
jgi:hypothetical protein